MGRQPERAELDVRDLVPAQRSVRAGYAGADKGIGLLICKAQGTFDAAGIYAGMILSTVLALLAELIESGAKRAMDAIGAHATRGGWVWVTDVESPHRVRLPTDRRDRLRS